MKPTCLPYLLAVCCISAANAAPDVALAGALGQPVLAPQTTAAEWAAFVRARIPRLEAPASAAAWEAEAERRRRAMLENVVFKGVPESWYQGPLKVEFVSDLETPHGYRVRKLRYEAAPGMWIPALLYEPTEPAGKVPAVLSVNGHVGDPGKANTEDQIREIVLAKRGVIALHPEWISFGELKHPDNAHNQLACLSLCGVSGYSVFYLAMKRGLDVLTEYPAVDTRRIAMTGLSGGGWQTIILSSLDPRIAVTAPNAGYSGIDARVEYAADIGDLEQVPPDMLFAADYTHLTAMLAPRPALLIYNAKDECCFRADHMAASVFDPVIPIYGLYGRADVFRMHINEDPGTHNYAQDNRLQFYRHISDHFGLGWDATEPDCAQEVRSFDELRVGIPETNATLIGLAEGFLESVPVHRAPVEDPIALAKWQEEAKLRLRAVIRLPEWEQARAGEPVETMVEGLRCRRYVLKTGEWSTPAVVIEPENAAHTTILFGDDGRGALADTAAALAASGTRVVAIDLLLRGECVVEKDKSHQHAMLIETAGERVLGQQAAQVAAVAAWARETFADPVAVHARGWNSGVVALMYGGLYRKDLHRLTTEDAPASLKDLIRQRISYNTHYPLFCFGLLREFDTPDLAAMCHGMGVTVKRGE